MSGDEPQQYLGLTPVLYCEVGRAIGLAQGLAIGARWMSQTEHQVESAKNAEKELAEILSRIQGGVVLLNKEEYTNKGTYKVEDQRKSQSWFPKDPDAPEEPPF